MTLDEYQKKAYQTVQTYNSMDQENFFMGFLGLAGETGTVLTTLKKLIRDGIGFGTYNIKLKEELGDVLWYVSAIASHNQMSLEEIGEFNIEKTIDRFRELDLTKIPRLDKDYPEQFPDQFTVRFVEEPGNSNLMEVKMLWIHPDSSISELGDPLTDNAREPNNYRFHDVFHLGHVAYLGWSPVLRHLMKLKRKSDHFTLDAEDRGRPQVAEEAVTLIIYNYAQKNKMLKASDRLDTELLNMIKQLVVDLEVSVVSSYQWEQTILASYKVFHKVLENRGGDILVSPVSRELRYLGKS